MKVIVTLLFILLSHLTLNGCKKGQITEVLPQDTTDVIFKKPNVYLYPLITVDITISINFPNGGEIIDSDPPYNEGWNVTVDPSGEIDNKYDYLFYECVTPDKCQYSSGWMVKQENLMLFFQDKLKLYGFSCREIQDFLDYWISKLIQYPYYIIYPQMGSNLNRMIQLNINPKPDSMQRLYFCIKGTNSLEVILEEEKVEIFTRNGFTVVEWGVILKE